MRHLLPLSSMWLPAGDSLLIVVNGKRYFLIMIMIMNKVIWHNLIMFYNFRLWSSFSSVVGTCKQWAGTETTVGAEAGAGRGLDHSWRKASSCPRTLSTWNWCLAGCLILLPQFLDHFYPLRSGLAWTPSPCTNTTVWCRAWGQSLASCRVWQASVTRN